MISTQLILYVAAAIVLLVGAIIDSPRFNTIRCIALAGALLILAQIVGVR
jgi:hypothetical protein